MLDSLHILFAATVIFVASHFLLSSLPLRRQIMRSLGGERGFRILYSLVALVTFVWMIKAYGEAPYLEVWAPPPVLSWVPLLVMPFALILAVAGLTVPSPTAVGGESRLAVGDPGNPAPGILSITRHPFLWGVTLWALSHLAVNGDAATMILMGGLLTLVTGGMLHIDQRRAATLGAAWGPFAMTTSLVPFAAILNGRTKLDLAGIGWWRPALGLVLYALLLWLHPLLIGVPAWSG